MGYTGYGQAGANHSKKSFKGFNARSRSPSEDIDNNNYTLRQRARILSISAPFATSILKTYRTNTIGTGLICKPKINGEILGLTPEQTEQLQETARREFYLWANDKRLCDATGVNDFNDMQQLAFLSYLTSGDVFALKKFKDDKKRLYSTCWHIIEADRVATPVTNKSTDWRIQTKGKAKNGNTIYDGVEIDKDGAVVAYYICNQYPDSPVADLSLKFERVEAYGAKSGLPNVLQVMATERPEQYRGVSILAPVIEPILQMRRYTDAELTAAIIGACFTTWITKDDPQNDPLGRPQADEPPASSNPDDYQITPGVVNVLKTGESVSFGDPKHPSGGFSQFVEKIVQMMGAGVELPGELVAKMFNSSYSASRAAFLEAQKAFKMQRKWFAADFTQPIYEAFLAEAVARGRVNMPGFFDNEAVRREYCAAEWIGPAMSQIDPTKEIAAMKDAVAAGFKTRTQATLELSGADFSLNVEELKRENAALLDATQTNNNQEGLNE